MSYKTLMVQLELGRSNAGPLGVVRDLTKRMRSAVSGVAAAQSIQVAVMADGLMYSGDILREDGEWIDQQAKIAEEEFRTEMDGYAHGLDWSMAVTNRPLSDRIGSMTGAADILVVGVDQDSGEFSNSTRRVDIDDLIMHVGRPVLLVPLKIKRFDFRCALVAWKDSRETRRALADALPLLRLMDKVVIGAITDASQQGVVQAGLNKMVGWLAKHEITASSHLALSSGDDGERLLTLADEIGADLIVAGAYGHSRFREWVLGGVTRQLLHKSGRCLLLSH